MLQLPESNQGAQKPANNVRRDLVSPRWWCSENRFRLAFSPAFGCPFTFAHPLTWGGGAPLPTEPDSLSLVRRLSVGRGSNDDASCAISSDSVHGWCSYGCCFLSTCRHCSCGSHSQPVVNDPPDCKPPLCQPAGGHHHPSAEKR